MHQIDIRSIQDLPEAVDRLLEITEGHNKFAFAGTMGSGKTTVINAICKKLGVVNLVTSPSFALVNEYTTGSGQTIYHFDLYRIKAIGELYDLGYEEYFYSDAWCFIEWAEKAEEIIPDEFIHIDLEVFDNQSRRLTIDL